MPYASYISWSTDIGNVLLYTLRSFRVVKVEKTRNLKILYMRTGGKMSSKSQSQCLPSRDTWLEMVILPIWLSWVYPDDNQLLSHAYLLRGSDWCERRGAAKAWRCNRKCYTSTWWFCSWCTSVKQRVSSNRKRQRGMLLLSPLHLYMGKTNCLVFLSRVVGGRAHFP